MKKTLEDKRHRTITPETYLGFSRGNSYHPSLILQRDKSASYQYQGVLGVNQVGLKGQWLVGPESIQAKGDDSVLELNFIANRVYLVMQSPVLLNDKPVPARYHTDDMNEEGKIRVHEARMYDVLDLKGDYGNYTVMLQVPKAVSVYVFTFGHDAQ
jgi:hypothetical protein